MSGRPQSPRITRLVSEVDVLAGEGHNLKSAITAVSRRRRVAFKTLERTYYRRKRQAR